MKPVTEIVVVVPAHDEEQLLQCCLQSLAIAARRVPVPVRVDVVLDACTDRSAGVVTPGALTVVVSHDRNVGAARAAGFAATRIGEGTWCASTDADTEVGPTWLQAQLRHAARGVDVLVGTVRTTGWSEHPVGLRSAFEAGYTQADGHHHVHGANLGVAGRAYTDLSGFAGMGLHENVDLVRRTMTAGLVVAGVPTRTRWPSTGSCTGTQSAAPPSPRRRCSACCLVSKREVSAEGLSSAPTSGAPRRDVGGPGGGT